MSNPHETEIKTAVGNLLMRADPLSKRVLTKFDPFAKQTVNAKSLNSFNLDLLEPCATFLGLDIADADSHKLYTKESLVSRIIYAIRALLPSQCSECSQQYVVDLDPENPPLFKCHMCYQGSHDCEAVTSLHTSLSSASINLLAGHVWLCASCLSSSSPVKQRRSKSRHNSISNTASSLARVRNELQGPDIQSPTESPLVTPGDTTPIYPEDLPNTSVPVRDLSSELSEHLLAVSRERVCPRFKSGKCPHGLKGNKLVNGQKCELGHPKRCIKFCQFGGKHRHGCNKGSNCEYYHPTICKFSLQSRLCTNEECTFVHLKGTKRKESSSHPNQRPEKFVTHQDNRQMNEASRQTELPASTPDHFLELKRLVLSMQSTFQQEIADIKSSLIPSAQNQNLFHQPQMRNMVPLQSQQVLPQQQLYQIPPHHFHQVPTPQMTFIPPSSF